ncbi:hypothetical protein ACSIGC_03730 [Tenacibaculum sp. ZS6-P6]|uniref:hypothetical protein n=1 Tax=Tenacibaculum sp. ZS6-P6 TaxID=3447503 RepID=UPI003F9A9A68
MNSYNENLQASILSTLSEQETKLQKTKANLDASMFSLYYAQGARITAAEELQKANVNYKEQQAILEQMVIDSDVSTNVLSTTNLANTFIPETVSNTAVAAANVQIATNAIIKLASDVGSIFSIVNAADYGTEIYDQSKYANELMNGKCTDKSKVAKGVEGTAYLAENTSRLSMEASAEIAEVPIANLTEIVTSTDTAIKALLEVVNTNFNTASETILTDTTALTTSNSTEKKAEGSLEDSGIVYLSTQEAYDLSNKQLNLDLKVDLAEGEVKGRPTSYTVSFNSYKSPFAYEQEEGITSGPKKPGYPVNDYYIFLVKNKDKNFFSISDAEGLITESEKEHLYIKIPSTIEKKYSQKIQVLTEDQRKDDTSDETYLKDVNGEFIKIGENYVVYVFAVFDNGYKKIINTFDDYLTAPSATFSLKNQLVAPDADKIEVNNNKLTFTLDKKSNFDVEYRCMFLLYSPELTKGLLTFNDLIQVKNEVEELEKENKSKIEKLKSRIKDLNDQITNKGAENTDLDELKAELERVNSELKALEEKKEELTEEIQEIEGDKPEFFFNYTIAKSLERESYRLASSNGKKKYSLEIDITTTDSFGNSLINGKQYIPVVLAMSSKKDERFRFIGALSDAQQTDFFTYTITK